ERGPTQGGRIRCTRTRDQVAGGSEARLSRLLWEQETGGSNPPRPTIQALPQQKGKLALRRASQAGVDASSATSLHPRGCMYMVPQQGLVPNMLAGCGKNALGGRLQERLRRMSAS